MLCDFLNESCSKAALGDAGGEDDLPDYVGGMFGGDGGCECCFADVWSWLGHLALKM